MTDRRGWIVHLGLEVPVRVLEYTAYKRMIVLDILRARPVEGEVGSSTGRPNDWGR